MSTDFNSLLPFVMSIATPLTIAMIFILAGRSMARTLLVLSLVSLGLIALDAFLFAYEVFTGLYGRLYDETLLGLLETIRVFLLGVAGLPTLAVWILTLYDTARTRRWVWLAAAMLMGLLAYATGGYGRFATVSFTGWLLYEAIVTRNAVWLNVVLTVLTHAAAVIPLAYALRYRHDTDVPTSGDAALAASAAAVPAAPSSPALPDA